MKITIIGAGIGGLTTAIALEQRGFEVEIFEATPQFKRAGSGINLAINAMQVYKILGLYDEIYDAGSHTEKMVITDEKMKTLSVVSLLPYEVKYGVKSVAIHRAKLHQILLSHVSKVPIHLGKKVKSLVQSDTGINIKFEDDTTHHAEIVIGADGIHSIVRKAILKNTVLRKAKQICWRGITKIDLPIKYQKELNESWGQGKRFGFVAIAENEYYWYALANYKHDFNIEYDDIDLETFYQEFHPIVSKIIASTLKEDILTNEMADLKPLRSWYSKNICLLGDAAHATTPNLGQGACQAIESALVLSNCLAEFDSAEKAFEVYQTIRMNKAVKIVNTSWRIGKMAHMENSLAVKLRNFILKITPQNIAANQTSYIFKIDK